MPAGKLVKSSSLAEKEIFLDPGDYLLLLRFVPDGMDNLEIFSEEPSLFLKNLSLKPGDTLSLNRGPATIDLKINQIPYINFLIQPFRGVRGNEFFSAKNGHEELEQASESLRIISGSWGSRRQPLGYFKGQGA